MMECRKHKGKNLIVVCSQCNNEPVCKECIVELHNGHVISNFEDAVKIVRSYVQDLSVENADVLTQLTAHLGQISNVQKEQKATPEEIFKEVQEKRESLYKLIDTVGDEVLREYQQEWQKNNEILQQHFNIVSTHIEKGENLAAAINAILKKESNIEVIQDAFNLDSNPPDIDLPVPQGVELKETPVEVAEMTPVFGNVNKCSPLGRVKDLEQSQQPAKMSLYSKFGYGYSERISAMSSSSRGLCYVICEGSTAFSQIDENGQHHERFRLYGRNHIHGIDYDQDGSVYVCSEGPNCIIKLFVSAGNARTLFSTNKLVPHDVRRTSSGDFYVVLLDEVSEERFDSSKRILVKYDYDGKPLAVAEKDNFGDYLFTQPLRLRTNHTEDTLLVVNQVTENLAYFVLLNKCFRVKLRYLGHGRVIQGNSKFVEPRPESTDNVIIITDATFDLSNNILICESHSKSVQRLSPSCDILQVLFEFDDIPRVITINFDAKVWVVTSSRKFSVLESSDSLDYQ